MASPKFLAFFLLFSSWIFVGSSQGLDALIQEGNVAVGIKGEIPPCMQKLLPCQPFIKAPTNPAPTCCLPLKQMLAADIPCLCSFFDNAELLKALNVTQRDALKLPQACGANVDTSLCKKAGATPPTAAAATTAPPPPPAKTKTTNDSTTKPSCSPRNSPAYGIGSGFSAAGAASFVALLLSAL